MIGRKKVLRLIDERIEELGNGLFVVELNISPANVIQVELDKYEGNVSVDDCIRVSRNVEHNLDREEEDFELTVTSAGLDRGLRVFPQYQKNIGRDVKVKLIEGSGKIEGTMIAATEEQITVQTTRKEKIEGKKKKETIVEDHIIPMADIRQTKIVLSFK